MFLWQLPHSLAIARLYREDYARAGIQLLPIVEPDGKSTGRQIVINCLALLPVGLLPTLLGLSGPVYFFAALVFGMAFLAYGISFAVSRTAPAARQLLLASLLYLPAVLDRHGAGQGPVLNRSLRLGLVRGALVLCAGMLLTAATWACSVTAARHQGRSCPCWARYPSFRCWRARGRPLSRRDLAGSIWIADFIFTRCGSICPILTAQMAKIQAALARAGDTSVRLVSFSVDPTYDTPEVLQEYATRFHADPNRWTFVTGQRNALYGLIGAGFHLAVADRPEGKDTDGGGLITHGDSFVLVDGSFNIRGYYHGTDAAVRAAAPE